MILKRFFEESLAHASYLVGCPVAAEAIIVDPNRDVDQYIQAAAAEGLRITGIAETHIHADYVSGARELSELTGATLYLSAEGGPDWQYAFPDMSRVRLVRHGDSFRVGPVRFDVLHTPGHTPEHVSFLITDEATSPESLAVFTGDFVFVGDVGRPDLLENAAGIVGTMEPGARDLFKSLQQFKKLPEFVALWPAHGAGSACGKSLGGVPVTTLGYEARSNWAFKAASEDGFVSEVLGGQPEPPPYFARMKVVNKAGANFLHGRSVRGIQLDDIGDRLLLDVRPSSDYLRGHAQGALHIPLGKSFLRWAGWLLSAQDELVIVAESAREAGLAAIKLSLIGIDNVAGWISAEQLPLVSTETATGEEMLSDRSLSVLDVRTDAEWLEGHVPDAAHLPLQHLRERVSGLASVRYGVHCGSGARSPIAASVLERAGHKDVVCVTSGYPEIAAALDIKATHPASL